MVRIKKALNKKFVVKKSNLKKHPIEIRVQLTRRSKMSYLTWKNQILRYPNRS